MIRTPPSTIASIYKYSHILSTPIIFAHSQHQFLAARLARSSVHYFTSKSIKPTTPIRNMATISSAIPISLEKTDAVYQKDGTLITHETTLSSLTPLSSFPEDVRGLFKAVSGGEKGEAEPWVVTVASTIFHAQGGGQPSDTGVIRLLKGEDGGNNDEGFTVHQVRKLPSTSTILHLVTPLSSSSTSSPNFLQTAKLHQSIDAEKRTLHSRLHTAGHALGLAISMLSQSGTLPSDLQDGKASHYPSTAFVEFTATAGGLIMSSHKDAIQAKVDELVAADYPVGIEVLSRAEAGARCIGGVDGADVGEEEGVRVVDLGGLGCYACGGTHVGKLGEIGRVVVRNIKRQKGVSKVGYDVV
ncbi:unnamed protein product [Periconia digitata]|uniref:Alanyl-transfer RNA synthetases family profile domain-containing protein n=1 Tax=Periconia digitata TaxID=1303443 RepID=A0A9W4XQP4_9PLEO|nr:unnamed protein product [Periconia digitata]